MGNDGALVQGSFKHWDRLPTQAGNGSWVQDSAYGFVHNSPARNSTGWRYPPLHDPTGTQNLLNLESAAVVGGGVWKSAGQNTRYDAELNVEEYRDLRDIFSAATHIRDGRFVVSNFSNAQRSQVFYQGFEDVSGAPPVFEDHNKNAMDYMALFNDAYTGRRAHEGRYESAGDSSFEGRSNLYTPQVVDARSDYWISFHVKDTTSVFVTSGSDNHNIDLTPTTPSTTAEVIYQPVEQGWTLVRVKVSGGGDFVIDPGAGRLDDIAMYPAAHGDLRDQNYRAGAQPSFFAYHPQHGKVISITDARGRTLRFQYNARGQLWRTYDMDGRVKTEHYKSFHGQGLDGSNPGWAVRGRS